MHALLPAFEFTSMVTSNDLGAVFFANQKSLDRQVALKVFSPSLAADDTFRKAFGSSSKLAAGLRHHNLIGILDSGQVDGMPYLVMEFVPGKSLARSTRGQVVEFGQSLAIIGAICEGLAHAHEAGLVHGHLDTSSILLNQQAVPKLGNFGLGRIVHTDPDTHAPRHFVAPEVLVDPAAATKASDVFSAAAIFHELITGQPYSPAAPAPSTLCGCRKTIDTVLKQATDPDPGKRQADAEAFRAALVKAAEPPRKTTALATASPSPAPLPMPPKSGFDSKLLVKLAIIFVLLFAILFTWETLKKTRADREKQNREILAKREAAKEASAALIAEQKAMEEARRKATQTNLPPDRPVIEERPETPDESLARLRVALSSGARADMPVGSVKRGDRYYFLVEEPMSWAEAALFAEEHGAHLAHPGEDSEWLGADLTKGRECWLGAARYGAEPDSWVRCDGQTWSPSQPPAGNGLFLVSMQGELRSADDTKPLPFVIEWHADGTNPGSLESQLAATRASLNGASPIFPPGTQISGERHILFVPRPIDWQEARELAEKGGGHLLVSASSEEITAIQEMSRSMKARDGIWLGGSLEEDHWLWTTGEPWQAAAWADDSNASDEGVALALRPGEGWIAMDRDDKASGFLIEWSEDKNATAPENTSPAPTGKAAELDARVKELVAATADKRDQAFADNVKKFGWDLDSFLRNLNRGDQDRFGPSVRYLKESVDGNRLLVEQIKEDWNNGDITVAAEMAKLLNYHSGKENEIETKFTADVSKIRDAYIAKLAEIRDEVKAAGQIKIASDLDDTIEEAGDLTSWLESFDVIFDANRKDNETNFTPSRKEDLDRDRDRFKDGLSEEEEERLRRLFRDRDN